MSTELLPPIRHQFISVVEHERDPVTGICIHCGAHNIPRQDGRPLADCCTRKMCVHCKLKRNGAHIGEVCEVRDSAARVKQNLEHD